MKVDLEVVGKPLTYATRRLMPGEPFQASRRDARLLLGLKRAQEAQPKDEIAALREEYARKVGKKPFMGWDAATLRAKMAEADKG